MAKKKVIDRIDKDGAQAAIRAQREAEEARREADEGAPTEYTVAGQSAFRDHEPGATFEATLDPVEEARHLASGALVRTADVEAAEVSDLPEGEIDDELRRLAAVHAQREAEKASREQDEGAPTEYRVAGSSKVFGHEPGSTFEATLDSAQEARLLASGALVKAAAVVEFASEAAEAKAKELGVDLTLIKPSGSGDKATVADVEAAATA